MKEPLNIDFSTVLAASVHDMKNSLCMLIQSIEELTIDEQNVSQQQEIARLHYEASRLNTNLLQLLSLYRAEKHQLPLTIEEHFMSDLIDEVIAKNELYINNRNLNIEIEVDPELAWYIDMDLITNLLNDIFINSMRYCDSKINIVVHSTESQLTIEIHDDGHGYPESMLELSEVPMQELSLSAGRTGLGLFFARLIANAHENQGVHGYIQLQNGGKLGGSVFKLFLP